MGSAAECIAVFLLLCCTTQVSCVAVKEVKLIDGFSGNEGTVLLLFNSTWGLICDDGWNLLNANVACRQAGFGAALEYTTGNRFRTAGITANKDLAIVLDDVKCSGSEAALTDCPSRPIGQHDCRPSEAAGVRCSPVGQVRAAPPGWNPLGLAADRRLIEDIAEPVFRLRLVPLRADGGGALLAEVAGSNAGPVCGDSATLREANAICRHLGLGLGRFLHSFLISELQLDGHLNASGSARPVLTLGNCLGDETNISQCTVYGSPGGVPCKSERFGLGVTCTSDLPDLVPDAVALQSSAYIANVPMYYMACALEEKCASPAAFEVQRNDPHWLFTSRILLRFSSIISNEGTRDFLPLRDTDRWDWHLCHMHYHSMAYFAHYEVYTKHNSSHQTLATGHKASFCLEDNACRDGAMPRFRCSQDPKERGSQGISPGCKDIYMHDLDCQWVDITELAYGRYAFRIVINPEYLVAESSYKNNAIICEMHYALNYISLFNCRAAHPFEY